MKVLITGGYGFIGSHTVERFYKEGYKIYIIDNLSSGSKDNITIKHKFYELNVEDKKCKEVFENNAFDVVVHLAAHTDAASSLENPCLDAKSNIMGLINMLQLSSKYNVKKFIFASSAAVYGNNDNIPLSEEEKCNPIAPYGASKLTGEQYCRLWGKIHDLDTICLRFSNVYGPKQSLKGEGRVVATFMNNLMNNKKLPIYGGGEQTRDFIYVEDVVDAIFKSVEFSSREVLNISSNKQYSVNELVESMRRLHPSIECEYKQSRREDILHSMLSNASATKDLNWITLYSLDQGIERTFNWYKEYFEKNQNKRDKKKVVREKSQKDSLFKKVLPYIENILAFVIVFFLLEFTENYDLDIIDLRLVYIIIIGLIYGLKQVSITVFLSCILFIWDIRGNGHDIISLIYNSDTLIHLSLYIFVGTVLGYSVDSKKYEVDHKNDELKGLKDKFDFLHDMYDESKNVRKELQDQIISVEDSFGKIYKTISVLDTLEPEKVFGEAVNVVEEIMKSENICIFSVTKDQKYLRLISKSKNSDLDIDKSIKVSDVPEIKKLVEEKTLFVNKAMKKALPMMMSPIVVNDNVLAIIAVYKMEFETLSQYKQNLFQVISNLITSSLARAYQYEQAIYNEKYIAETLVLRYKYFAQLLESKVESKQKSSTAFILLKVCELEWQQDIAHDIAKSIRELDYIGVNENNVLFVLLSNTDREEATYVVKRFNSIKIKTEIIEEREYYDTMHIGTFSA